MAEDTEEGPPPVGPDSDRNNVSFASASAASAVPDAGCSDADVTDVDADRDQSNTAVSDGAAAMEIDVNNANVRDEEVASPDESECVMTQDPTMSSHRKNKACDRYDNDDRYRDRERDRLHDDDDRYGGGDRYFHNNACHRDDDGDGHDDDDRPRFHDQGGGDERVGLSQESSQVSDDWVCDELQ